MSVQGWTRLCEMGFYLMSARKRLHQCRVTAEKKGDLASGHLFYSLLWLEHSERRLPYRSPDEAAAKTHRDFWVKHNKNFPYCAIVFLSPFGFVFTAWGNGCVGTNQPPTTDYEGQTDRAWRWTNKKCSWSEGLKGMTDDCVGNLHQFRRPSNFFWGGLCFSLAMCGWPLLHELTLGNLCGTAVLCLWHMGHRFTCGRLGGGAAGKIALPASKGWCRQPFGSFHLLS